MERNRSRPQFENAASHGHGVFAHAARQVRQFMCGLNGHDTLLHFGNQRHVSLICTSCGYESPGWNVPGAPVRPENAPLLREPSAPLVREQRIA
jgi:hypothetical protein